MNPATNSRRPTPALTVEFPPGFYEAIAAHVARLLGDRQSQDDPWLDVAGAARHLGYGDADEAKLKRGCDRVYDLKARREIQYRKDGSRLIFRRSWLDEYVE